MIFFLSFQFTGLAVVLAGFILYAKRKEIPVFFFIWHKKRIFFALEALVFALIILVCIKPLTNNIRCAYNGHSMNKVTKYDWINGQCLVEYGTGKNNKPTYVPYERIRGTSGEGSEDGATE
ncbi:hypothetical protein [Wohlfahrtiimonas chitiniclastica]|uniref:hypothetical protein n=1 Tax=Wohlfahrtiimonas chitiniclastica TaxID=400946 RepID=UPI002157AF31|nr:hypothetical protein [Wohlfahrtiimonas chitiniclastica]MDC7251564.1 hypothetical protein [Wohlfahrtiimonas chitiniclastica]